MSYSFKKIVLLIFCTVTGLCVWAQRSGGNGAGAVQSIPFGHNGRIEYNLDKGTYTIRFGNSAVISDAYATGKADHSYDSRLYASRKYEATTVQDAFGKGVKHQITLLDEKGQWQMQQVFYVYPGKEYVLAELRLAGAEQGCNYMSPLSATRVALPKGNDQRALFVPFDNDAWVRYNAAPLNMAAFTSSEVTALYNAAHHSGLVLGSIEHNDWKSGISIIGTAADTLSQLIVFAGYADSLITRDAGKHGQVMPVNGVCRSPRMLIGGFADWRDGLETYGQANRLAEPAYVFHWNKPKPMGWNSWGAIQDKLTLEKAMKVADFFADSCKGFRNAGGTLYLDLDSYWDNLTPGGNLDKLVAFCTYCKKKGIVPGVYWAPFVDWSKDPSRKVEGSNYTYQDCWTKTNGHYHDMDGARALDPTHPATKARIAWLIGRFKTCGFAMIKIDFLGHAAIEGDSFYDKQVHTGMQAYRQGMEYLADQMDNQMLVYAAISPSLATGRYAHMRRIACDAYKAIHETSYTLNSTSYGWWLDRVYTYNDADHVVFGTEQPGANRARLTSSIITGTVITGDDYSTAGAWTGTAQQLLQNKDLLAISPAGKSFRPVTGNTGNQADNFFVFAQGKDTYVAVLNYSDSVLNQFYRLPKWGKQAEIKELFSGKSYTATNQGLAIMLPAADAAIYRIRYKK